VTSAAVAAQTWAHPWARPQPARATPDGWRRVLGSLNEPNAWTVGVVLATGVVLIARHPIARALGTETPSRPLVTAEAPARTHAAPHVPSLALSAVAVPTHAPRDPFRALVTAAGKVLAPVDAAAAPPASAGKVVPAPTPASVSASCAGTSHRVVGGDTLWTIAARSVRSSDSARVTVAWHRLYAANRAVVGANPSVLQVGSALCVPTSL